MITTNEHSAGTKGSAILERFHDHRVERLKPEITEEPVLLAFDMITLPFFFFFDMIT